MKSPYHCEICVWEFFSKQSLFTFTKHAHSCKADLNLRVETVFGVLHCKIALIGVTFYTYTRLQKVQYVFVFFYP